jgi:hypothetical protein
VGVGGADACFLKREKGSGPVTYQCAWTDEAASDRHGTQLGAAISACLGAPTTRTKEVMGPRIATRSGGVSYILDSATGVGEPLLTLNIVREGSGPPKPAAAAGPAKAQSGDRGVDQPLWRFIQNEGGVGYYLRDGSVNAGKATVLEAYAADEPAAKRGRPIHVALWSANCATGQTEVVAFDDYDEQGRKVAGGANTAPKTTHPKAGTIGAAVRDIICRHNLPDHKGIAGPVTMALSHFRILLQVVDDREVEEREARAAPPATRAATPPPLAAKPIPPPPAAITKVGLCEVVRRAGVLAGEDFRSVDIGAEAPGLGAASDRRTSLVLDTAKRCFIAHASGWPVTYTCEFDLAPNIGGQTRQLGEAMMACLAARAPWQEDRQWVQVKVRKGRADYLAWGDKVGPRGGGVILTVNRAE